MLGAFTSMFWGGESPGSEETTAIDTIDREDEAGAAGSKPGDGAAVDADLNDVAEKTEEKGADVKKKAEEGSKAGEEEEEEEEKEECGFCKFMKGGSCKATFVAWEDCVDAAKEGKEDFVEKCAEQTAALRDCMIADPKYYGDMLEGSSEDAEGDEDVLPDSLDDPIDGEKDETAGDTKKPAPEAKKASK